MTVLTDLILHIGTHKTATTYLQKELASQCVLLNRHGVGYRGLNDTRANLSYESGPSSKASLLHTFYSGYERFKELALRRVVLNQHGEGDRGLSDTRANLSSESGFSSKASLLHDFCSGYERFIVSDENLLGKVNHLIDEPLYARGLTTIDHFLKLHTDIETTVVISLRDSCSFLASMYCEYLRHYSYVSFEKYVERNNPDTINWFELFSPLAISNPKVKFKIFNFNAFRDLRESQLNDLSFGILEEFTQRDVKSRVTLTNEAIRFLGQFPSRSKGVLRKMEATSYVYGNRFEPFSESEMAASKQNFEDQLSQLSGLSNTHVLHR